MRPPGPDEIFGKLFQSVQEARLFKDSKTFADAIPRLPVDDILERFKTEAPQGAALRDFVERHFDLPSPPPGPRDNSEARSVNDYVESLWPVLTRQLDAPQPGSSHIPLPHPYVVPGGRFREIYYWDSYFTMLGLAESGRTELVENMVDNFAWLIDKLGFIPNGNRSYFCTRSQPPFFALMVELLSELKRDADVLTRYAKPLMAEYDFWTRGSDKLLEDRQATRRVVRIGDAFLSRYWDDVAQPRAESYAEDKDLAAASDRDAGELYRDIRAACESGWDFSSRWLDQSMALGSCRTTAVVPVDLNVLLWKLETVLSEIGKQRGRQGDVDEFTERARQRADLIRTLFFDEDKEFFVDLLWPSLEPSPALSLAGAFPLFMKLAGDKQAIQVADRLEEDFLAPGGWRTTLVETGQQWDRPNGWAPLQWIVHCGLRHYGHERLAIDAAKRWVNTNVAAFEASGRLMEKYDVDDPGRLAGGGEYALQDGFGWTNAVLLCLSSLHYRQGGQ